MDRQNGLAPDHIRDLLGDLDDERVVEILALRPSAAEIEAALMRANGDDDVLGQMGNPLDAKVAAIVEILTEDESEEER